MSNTIKLYVVDIEENTISRLKSLFYKRPDLGIEIIGYSLNYNQCINDFSNARDADVFMISAYLPDIMGIDLIHQVKRLNPDAKILVTLTEKTQNLAEQAIEKGADDFVQKPFKARDLLNKIYVLINGEEEEEEEEPELPNPTHFQEDSTTHIATESYPTEGYPEGHNSTKEFEDKFTMPNFSEEKKSDTPNFDADKGTQSFSFENKPNEQERMIDPFLTNYTPDSKSENHSFSTNESQNNSFSDPYNEPPKEKESRKLNIGMQNVFSEPSKYMNFEEPEEEFSGNKPNQVVVFSSTGSYGKTSLLVNACIAIKKLSSFNPSICIVDFNLLYPSVIFKFHEDDIIPCKKNIFDLFDDINDLKPELINSAMEIHEPTGIKILNTPSELIRDFSNITPDSINQLITHLRSMFDLVVIDTSSNIKDNFSSFPIAIADKTFVVLEPNLTSILHAHKLLNLLKMFETDLEEKIMPRINLVLNKESVKNKMDLELFKKSLMNLDVKVTIPEDPNMSALSNSGQFAVESNTASSKSIRTLANFIYPLDKDYLSRQTNTDGLTADKVLSFAKNIFKKNKK